VIIQATSPSTISFSLPLVPASFPSVHYVTTDAIIGGVTYADMAAGSIGFTVADKFGNPDAAGAALVSVTFTALTGGGFFNGVVGTTTQVLAVPNGVLQEYSQSSIFGTVGLISGTMTGKYLGVSFSVSGSTGRISTSTFDLASQLPTIDATTVTAPGCSVIDLLASCQAAGKTATVDYQLLVHQQGVPIEVSVDPSSTAVTKNGGFSGSVHTTVYTNAAGLASAVYSVDTGAGAIGIFNANVSAPIDGTPTNYLGNSGSSVDHNTVVTGPGASSTFVISTCFVSPSPAPLWSCTVPNTPGTSIVNGTSVFVDVSISDAYGNPTTVPSGHQIQLNLATSVGTLSATTIYLTGGSSDTYGVLGAVQWSMPKTVGTSVILSAGGVLSGNSKTTSLTEKTVVATPTFSVTSPAPLNGVIYSPSATVVFTGEANASVGYGPAVTIQSVGYKVNTGTWKSTTISPGNQILWSVAATFASGLSTIAFNATDSNSNTVTTSTYKVLVETTAPTLAFTTANGAVLNYSTGVQATIKDLQGDLNASSVTATYNGTAVAAANIAVTGTNNPGSSVNYGVSISNLPVGNWVVQLSASNYAGNSASASITVTVQVAFAQSVVITSAKSGTLGSFSGISVSATNLWSTSQNLVVFAVYKNGVGQTVAVSTGGLSLASGASGTAFAPLAGALPSGTYSVSVFVITTSNNPVSSTTSTSVTA